MAMAEVLKMNKGDSDKQKALDSALAQIERQFGKGSIMRLGAENAVQQIESTSTGSLGARYCTGHWRSAQRSDHRDLWPGKLR